MTRLGDFKFSVTNFFIKVAHVYVDFLGCLKISIFMYKLLWLLFGQRLKNFALGVWSHWAENSYLHLQDFYLHSCSQILS